jgi:glutathione S-transferase
LTEAESGYFAQVLTLYQAEWCPHSRKIRQKLTELGLEFLAKQVEAEPKDRKAMREQVGTDEIPVLVTGEGETIEGEDEILAWLDKRFSPRPDAEQHREQMLDKSGVPS